MKVLPGMPASSVFQVQQGSKGTFVVFSMKIRHCIEPGSYQKDIRLRSVLQGRSLMFQSLLISR